MSSRTLFLLSTCGIALLLGAASSLEAMNPEVRELVKTSSPLQQPEGTVPTPLAPEDLSLCEPKVAIPASLTLTELRDEPTWQMLSTLGELMETRCPLDMALVGEGYFMLMGPDGNILYTRDGRSRINEDGFLANGFGLSFLDERGTEISVKNGIKIDSDGTIRDRDGNVITRLGIVEFQSGLRLIPTGNCLLMTDATPLPAKRTFVHQGFLEQSKVELSIPSLPRDINL